MPTPKGIVDPTSSVSTTSELWCAPKPSRGPPPGLSAKGGSLANGWSGGNLGNMSWGGASQRSSGSWGGSSPWLLLRNLTAQVSDLCFKISVLSGHIFLQVQKITNCVPRLIWWSFGRGALKIFKASVS